MPKQRPDEDVPAILPTASRWWSCLQTVKSQLSGKLVGFAPGRCPNDRPRRFDNDAAFFEGDLNYIFTANFVEAPLSAERFGDLDNKTLNLLHALNDIVNDELIQNPEAQDQSEFESPENSGHKLYDNTKLPYRCERLSAILCFLDAHPKDRFSLVTGPDPPLFKIPRNGYGKRAMGYAKEWIAFSHLVAAEALASPSLQTIALYEMGIYEEEPDDGQAYQYRSRASEIVDAMFKEFRQLNCAGERTHEIRLRMSGLRIDPARPVLDLLVSCCPSGKPVTWHEAQCGSFPVSIDEAGKQSLCVAMPQATSENKKLHLLVHQQGLFDVTGKMPRISSSANLKVEALFEKFCANLFSEVTPEDVLNKTASKKARRQEKAQIALMLARCLLDFFDDDIELASHSWTPEQIFFICHSTTPLESFPTLHGTLGDIYVSLRPRSPRKVKTADILEMFRPGNPTLLSFARLLLEIEFGKKIDLTIDSETEKNVTSWAELCSVVETMKGIGRYVQYMDVVEGCLNLCKNLPKPEDRVTGSAASKVLRKAIYKKIIWKLEKIVMAQNDLNGQHLKRKREASVSECPQAKKPSISPLPRLESTLDGRMYESPEASIDIKEPKTFKDLQETWKSRFEFKEKDAVVKIAILDTGIDLLHEDFHKTRATRFDKGQPEFAHGETSQIDRMRRRKSFCGPEDDVQDLDGHGTQVASIILRLAPRAELCIARINHGDVNPEISKDEKQVTGSSHLRHPKPEIVVKAIKWAIAQEVDIINMSFGFRRADHEVDEALKSARDKGILVFAAMGNEGMYENAGWPARDSNVAIGIHSSVEMGKRGSSFTPKLVKKNSNFMVTGEGIIAHWLTAKGGGFRPVEGTSFATPIAVAMAALILAFANQKLCGDLRKKSGKQVKVEELWQIQGMRKMLEAISKKSKDGYLWINPKLLWAEYSDDGDEDTVVAVREHGWKVIRTALKK